MFPGQHIPIFCFSIVSRGTVLLVENTVSIPISLDEICLVRVRTYVAVIIGSYFLFVTQWVLLQLTTVDKMGGKGLCCVDLCN